jgi:exosortase/archaeosortase family protein
VGLFFLALPTIPSLQFYLGYPLRVVVAGATAPLLQLAGLQVLREGACLAWAGRLVWIDAPCSGIRMLWVGGYLACVLVLLRRLSFVRTVFVAAASALLILAANVLRAASLFYVETHLETTSLAIHDGVGICVFVLLALGIAGVVRLAHKGRSDIPAPEDAVAGAPGRLAVFLAACLAAGLVPLAPASSSSAAVGEDFPGWPETWNGRPLKPLELSARESRFARQFPGRVARFTDGHHELILRWVAVPTRKLHPASDCFRALGGRIRPRPLALDERGAAWGVFEVDVDSKTLVVHEQFTDGAGNTWSDVSSWYWSAVSGRTQGPWWVYVVVKTPAP